MPFNPSGLLADACFVGLGIDHFQQVQGVVDASGGETLDLLGFRVGLFRVGSTKIATSGEGTRTCVLGVLLFITTLVGSSFLSRCAGFLFCEKTGGFGLTGQ